MKRSPITRKTGLKRTAMKRKPRKYPPRKLELARIEWAKQFDHCMICCGRVVEPGNGYATIFKHVHHIAHKSLAPGKYEHPCNWLCVCAVCHDNLHNANEIDGNSYAACLAAKLIFDDDNYFLGTWLTLLGADESFVTHRMVKAARDAHYLHQLENIRRITRSKR